MLAEEEVLAFAIIFLALVTTVLIAVASSGAPLCAWMQSSSTTPNHTPHHVLFVRVLPPSNDSGKDATIVANTFKCLGALHACL